VFKRKHSRYFCENSGLQKQFIEVGYRQAIGINQRRVFKRIQDSNHRSRIKAILQWLYAWNILPGCIYGVLLGWLGVRNA
jgi:hypothetical protein